MKNKPTINEKWIKASILGTIWAASEIVLGSFLHNLRVPFSGNILTAIGLIILISVSYIWKEKGLFWRAGLICALMKTMSPSAVIFGPMIAIFSEAALLEISVRVFGKTIAGFVLGAILAMSWNLFQRIMNFIIFYGFNIIGLYSNLIKFAQKYLNIHTDILWLPILVLLFVYSMLGILSAIIGIKVGRKILRRPIDINDSIVSKKIAEIQTEKKSTFSYSMLWLFADILLLVGSLFLLNMASWVIWSLSITAIVAIWALRYKRALRQLSKPKFWISFVSITMLTAFLFSRFQPGVNNIAQGLMIGIQMNFRAVLIIVGFSVLGTELYNPKIREFFLRTAFKQLPLALELSFECLPSMIAHIPDFRTVIKNPVNVILQIVSQAEVRLAEMRKKLAQKVFIISGAAGQGKTTMLRRIVDLLRESDIIVGGFYSPRIMLDNATIGYDIVDVRSNEQVSFLRENGDIRLNKIGRFSIYPNGLEVGLKAIKSMNNIRNAVIIIDEVGKLELENQGWALGIDELFRGSTNHLVLIVRDTFTDQVRQKWNLNGCTVFDINRYNSQEISKLITQKLQQLSF